MIRVTSEIGRLRRVLVHAPEAEVDRMVPAMMEELLFDDILFGERAREEHAMFRRIFRIFDVEVLEARHLLGEALEDAEARDWLLARVGDPAREAWQDRIRSAPAGELAADLVHGIRSADIADPFEAHELYSLAPLPNWCFQRDPLVVLHEGVVFTSMATAARRRESILSRLVHGFHPDFADVPVLFDPEECGEGDAPWLEGGDVLVLSADVVAVGISERTSRAAVEALAEALAKRDDGPRHLIVVEIPKRRAYMHLDTLVTPIDRHMCLVFPPVMLGQSHEAARVATIDLASRERKPVPAKGWFPTLAALGLEYEPVRCGGADPVAQQREQWTDGANAFAIAPGVITLYDRNVRTADELTERGFRVVHARDLLLGREEGRRSADEKMCVLVPSHELSRARGGPHCLTHPLLRDDLG